MTESLLVAIVSLLAGIAFILILGLGKIYNRIDEGHNNKINEILDSLNKIESLLEEISADILMR